MSDNNKLPFSFSANFSTHDDTSGEAKQEQRDEPFRIVIVGNFSARMQSAATEIRDRKVISVDRYNFDDVFASMGLTLALTVGDGIGEKVEVPLSSIKDFHPDRLIRNVDMFARLREMRERLNNPQTFPQALLFADSAFLLPTVDNPADGQVGKHRVIAYRVTRRRSAHREYPVTMTATYRIHRNIALAVHIPQHAQAELLEALDAPGTNQ